MSDLILFDKKCPFCQKCILFLLKRDKKKKFLFSDLAGQSAKSMSSFLSISDSESIILIENYNSDRQRVFYRSKAVFKIFWKLDGVYKFIGWKYVLPAFLFDWVYRLVSKNRSRFCSLSILAKLSAYQDRFII